MTNTERFIPSPSLENASEIATWLNDLPNHLQVHQEETLQVIDWHIIPIGGKYQVIAHIMLIQKGETV